MHALLQAELLKIRKHPLGLPLLLVGMLLVAVFIILFVLNGTRLPGKGASTIVGLPSGLLFGPAVIDQTFGSLLVIIFAADLVGSEYRYHTWQNLLARRPGRTAFILCKWLALLLVLLCSISILALWSEGLMLVFGVPQVLEPAPGALIAELGVRLLSLLVPGSVALLTAIALRSSRMGVLVAVFWLIIDAGLVRFYGPGTQAILFTGARDALLQSVAGQAAVSPWQSLLVLFGYAVLPVFGATMIFQRRDMM